MSNYKIRDTMPGVRPAGKSTTARRDTFSDCVNVSDPPPTPPQLSPFRSSGTQQVGQSSPLHGRGKDELPSSQKTYGRVVKSNGTAADCMLQNDVPTSHMSPLQLREPLGKAAIHNDIHLPDKYQKESFRFGRASNKSEDCRTLLYPVQVDEKKFNETKEPGFQKKRNYDWASKMIDPNQHRFGKGSTQEEHEVVLKTSAETVLVASPTKTQRQLNNTEVGSPRRRGQAPDLEGSYTYGKLPTPRKMENTVEGVLRQHQDSAEVPIGVATTPSKKLAKLKAGDHVDRERVFGAPTIRTDKPAPDPLHAKLTSNTNYGFDGGAGDLLYPTNSGLSPVKVKKHLSLDAVLDLCSQANLDLEPKQIATAYRQAQGSGNAVTAETFMRAVTVCGY